MNKHTLKIEDVGISAEQERKIVKAFNDFALNVGYKQDRISDLECRHRPGFSPYEHNKGGLECVAFTSQYQAYFERTGFKNADKTLDLYHDYDIDTFVEDNGYPKNPKKWTDKQLEEFDQYQLRNENTEATVLFGMDITYRGKVGTKHSANIRITVCVKDAPYHRQFDDKISIDVEWTFHKELIAKLNEILKDKQVQLFKANVEEAY